MRDEGGTFAQQLPLKPLRAPKKLKSHLGSSASEHNSGQLPGLVDSVNGERGHPVSAPHNLSGVGYEATTVAPGP